MSYNRTNWENENVEFPNRIKIINSVGDEEIVDYERIKGTIVNEGTHVDAEHLNNIEDGIS